MLPPLPLVSTPPGHATKKRLSHKPSNKDVDLPAVDAMDNESQDREDAPSEKSLEVSDPFKRATPAQRQTLMQVLASNLKMTPQGVPTRYFNANFINRNTDNELLPLVLELSQKIKNISPIAIKWKLATRVLFDRQFISEISTLHDEKPASHFARVAYAREPVFPEIPMQQFVYLKIKYWTLCDIYIRNVVETKDCYKTRRMLDAMDEILKKLSCFGKFSRELRLQLCEAFTYQVFPRGTVIIKPADIAFSQYIILNGICRIKTIPQANKLQALYSSPVDSKDSIKGQTISLLSSGDSFGEFSNIREIERRGLRHIFEAATELHVLRLEKSKFLKIIAELDNKFTEKQVWLSSTPAFKSLSRYTIDTIARSSVIKKFFNKVFITRASDPDSKNTFFFLMTGDATAYRLTAFIKIPSSKSSFFKPRYTLIPYNSDKMISPTEETVFVKTVNQDIVFELVPVGLVPATLLFPHLLEARGHDKELRKNAILDVLNGETSVDKHTVIVGSSFTGVGLSPGSFNFDGGNGSGVVECLVIQAEKMISLCGGTEKLSAMLVDLAHLPLLNEKEAMSSFLSSKGWSL